MFKKEGESHFRTRKSRMVLGLLLPKELFRVGFRRSESCYNREKDYERILRSKTEELPFTPIVAITRQCINLYRNLYVTLKKLERS